MTTGGWIFIIASWGFILALCAYCFAKTLGLRIENMTAPLEIETEPRSGKRRVKAVRKRR